MTEKELMKRKDAELEVLLAMPLCDEDRKMVEDEQQRRVEINREYVKSCEILDLFYKSAILRQKQKYIHCKKDFKKLEEHGIYSDYMKKVDALISEEPLFFVYFAEDLKKFNPKLYELRKQQAIYLTYTKLNEENKPEDFDKNFECAFKNALNSKLKQCCEIIYSYNGNKSSTKRAYLEKMDYCAHSKLCRLKENDKNKNGK